MNHFDLIRWFYNNDGGRILASKKNEWGIPPNSWDDFLTMTPIELAIWERIRNANSVFYPQYPVGKYFADFGNPIAKVAIECDGKQFHQDKERDKRRDDFFESIGWSVYRIPGNICVTESSIEDKEKSESEILIEEISIAHGLVRDVKKSMSMDESLKDYWSFLLTVEE